MGPIRRYLRVSKCTVLECRIYLENPSDSRWLLDSHGAMLQRVIASIRPLVQPKLREEKERIKAKKKSKPVKDVLVEDDFEVSIFLRESGSRHSLLTRQKTFKNDRGRITSNSEKMTSGTNDSPIQIPEQGSGEARILVESDEDEQIPFANDAALDRSKDDEQQAVEVVANNDATKDEKKLGLTTTYDGFGIWGWVLCLIIKRKKPTETAQKGSAEAPGQALMEEWICTQAQQEYDD
ncbi:uncharacterized protein GIQ15_05957 [Arthroderma uncinatum]|uniref:uncharacterized protein n=1 Tax=Arthroderma uncinatum TaxID=74035 RepID=UPI00144AC5F3|nr:uncharacterized protein GIQ15_05957 [Arthroderma uncinatum]KAF3480610.1 hypothetical protein GIQ15_05957 [Arthroderma uncinatum]